MNKSDKRDIQDTLSSHGLNFNDFVFKETDLTVDNVNGIYSKAGEIIVTYKPTGISKKYTTGMLQTWPGSFEIDIDANFYKIRQ